MPEFELGCDGQLALLSLDANRSARSTVTLLASATMSFRSRDQDFDDFDDDVPLDEELEDDDATDECPYCGKEIYEDANWCPYCTNYISREDAPRRRRPWWLVAGVIVCLALVASWFLVF